MTSPIAMCQKPISAEKDHKSRPGPAPLKLFDCCPNADGAACLIIANAEKAGKLTDTPVWVAGLGLASSPMSLAGRKGPLTSFEVTKNAAKAAYNMARVGPNDVDDADVHDAFANTALLNYADLGVAKPAEGD